MDSWLESSIWLEIEDGKIIQIMVCMDSFFLAGILNAILTHFASKYTRKCVRAHAQFYFRSCQLWIHSTRTKREKEKIYYLRLFSEIMCVKENGIFSENGERSRFHFNDFILPHFFFGLPEHISNMATQTYIQQYWWSRIRTTLNQQIPYSTPVYLFIIMKLIMTKLNFVFCQYAPIAAHIAETVHFSPNTFLI